MRALSILLLVYIPASVGSSSSSNIRHGAAASSDLPPSQYTDATPIKTDKQSLLRGRNPADETTPKLHPQTHTRQRGRTLAAPDDESSRTFFRRIFGDTEEEEGVESEQVVPEQQQQQQQHPGPDTPGLTFDNSRRNEEEGLALAMVAVTESQAATATEEDTILTPEDQTIATAAASSSTFVAAQTPEGQSIASASGVGGIGAGSVGTNKPMDEVVPTEEDPATEVEIEEQEWQGGGISRPTEAAEANDGGGISRPLFVPEDETVEEETTAGFFGSVTEGIANFGSLITNGIRDSTESLVGSPTFCEVTGICFGPSEEDAPNNDNPLPPAGGGGGETEPSEPASPPIGNYKDAHFLYRLFFWKTGTLLETPAWMNSFNQMMFCRTLGTCFDVPNDVAATLPDLEGDPYWRDRLCDVANICFPTIAPTSAPTVTPSPSSIAREEEVTWPEAAPEPAPGGQQNQANPPPEEQPAPEPEEVRLFGHRDPDQPVRCRLLPGC